MKTLDVLKVLKITDGRAGHITITDGIISAIQKTHQVEIVTMEISIRTKFFLRILRFILRYNFLNNRFVLNDFFIKLFYKNYHKLDHKIDLIISTGGDTLFMNIWLCYMLGVKNIFSGSLRGINQKYFFLILSNINAKNCINLSIAPTRMIDENDLHQQVKYFCNEKKIDNNRKYFVLLIGGDGGGYKYDEDDYYELVNNFMSLVEKHKAKALITTSRRTGLKYEKLLKKLFSKYSDDIAYSVYFGQNPEKIVAVYLELASIVFVTEESGSMITESLLYKKPVFTLSPKNIKEQKKYKLFLNDLVEKQRINRLAIQSNLSDINLDNFVFKYIEKLPIEELSEKLQPFLKEIK
ncbi:MAG: mitochondrial fission ELM1 family protein [Epsilonproteobacteria bacterium]|nr:mitochondrial fission ELM1 family protein [Flavobacteriaceae bacterium]MBD3824517.1 mitochondrial fission ELM1 family protein [Campylobacterota bacterium]MBD3829005.1 mitochondrial fission ELM1 family protein [Arcobacter sp.]